jgi:hypothetical protein
MRVAAQKARTQGRAPSESCALSSATGDHLVNDGRPFVSRFPSCTGPTCAVVMTRRGERCSDPVFGPETPADLLVGERAPLARILGNSGLTATAELA